MIVHLKNRSLIKISGKDNLTFLQSQFSNNIELLGECSLQINTYCQHQGKIIAIFWVFKRDSSYYLSFPSNLKESVLNKLNIFKLMSEVDIEDISDQENQYGLIDEIVPGSIEINQNLSLLVTKNSLKGNSNEDFWEMRCIDGNLPEVHLRTSEKFIPQDLNLDVDEIGVSFTKGCYPGQEIVARMHYLGKPKRRLFRFISKFEANIGDSITTMDSASLKPSGVVLRVAKVDKNFLLLGTFEIKLTNEPVYLNNDVNKPLKIDNE